MEYSKLIVTKIGKRRWELQEDWMTPFGKIPKGFISNGASIPRWLWWFMTPAGTLFEAAIIHDYFYDNAVKTKDYADKVFLCTANHYHVKKFKRVAAYSAVKLFGKGKY